MNDKADANSARKKAIAQSGAIVFLLCAPRILDAAFLSTVESKSWIRSSGFKYDSIELVISIIDVLSVLCLLPLTIVLCNGLPEKFRKPRILFFVLFASSALSLVANRGAHVIYTLPLGIFFARIIHVDYFDVIAHSPIYSMAAIVICSVAVYLPAILLCLKKIFIDNATYRHAAISVLGYLLIMYTLGIIGDFIPYHWYR